jgi:long-chain-acyl-CoA dehydrogenase
MKRGLYDDDHEDFRQAVAAYVEREVAPHVSRWEDDRLIDRDAWLAAGAQGIIGLSAPAEHGGGGQTGYRFRNIVQEELAQVYATSLSSGFALQDDIAIPYIADLGTDEQQTRWLPPMVSGEAIGALAMTEPAAGSDLRGIQTAAKRVADGWVVNGSKTFITNGVQADLVVALVRTSDAADSSAFTLLVIERGFDGFSRGRQLEKIGMHAQDTAELFFDDVFVPDCNVLGTEGLGLKHIMGHLPLERLSIATHAIAVADAVLKDTVAYTMERTAFGKSIADFQNTRFELAELTTALDVGRAYVDAAIVAFETGDLSAVDAAKAKLWATDLQNDLVDRCLQLHGGYGYMMEYPVARACIESRIQRIFGGTNENMKEIIGRDVVGRR